MTDMLFLFSGIAAAGVRAFAYLFLISRLLPVKRPEDEEAPESISGKIQEKKLLPDALSSAALPSGITDKKKSRIRLAALVGVAAISAMVYVTGLPDFYRIALETTWLAFCAGRFLGADTRMSLFIGTFYEIAAAFLQFIAAAWLGVFFRSPTFLDSHTGNGQIALWIFHMLLFAFMLYIGRRPDMAGKEAFRLASGVVVAGFIAVVTLSQQDVLPIADDTVSMWTILAVVLMMSVLVFNMNRQYEMEKELARLQSEHAELLERDYTTLNHAYEINAKLFHDFHNHIGVLRKLLSHGELEDAIRYLDELQAPVQEMADTVWTGDKTVDYLINSKAGIAAANDIRYQVQVEFPSHTNLRSADLCAILGNFLDNALEAAGKAPEKEGRFVRLIIRRINQMLVIKVENSFAVLPVKEGGTLKTTKEENGLHGWGIKSARAAAMKYDGTVQVSYTGNAFRAVATLSYQGISIES